MCLRDSYARYFTGRYSLMNFCYLQKPLYTRTLIHLLSLSLGACLSHVLYVGHFHDSEILGIRVCLELRVCIAGCARSKQ